MTEQINQLDATPGLALGSETLFTPIYFKLRDDAPWPEDEVFFVLSRDGLHLCRNHRFFRSSVPAPRLPSELGRHETFLELTDFPRIPRALLERAVGFFHEVYQRHGSEAGLLLVWNESTGETRLVCPQQRAAVRRSSYDTYPLDLHYTIPDLAADDRVLGDLHSHADEPAYASATDKADEQVRTGVHVVVGRLGDIGRGRRPQFHVDLVADGTRFTVRSHGAVFEGYHGPDRSFPTEWLDCLEVETIKSYWSIPYRDPDEEDRR